MRFSERMGLVPRRVLQVDSMDDRLRNALWNAVMLQDLTIYPQWSPDYFAYTAKAVWSEFLGRSLTSMPHISRLWPEMESQLAKDPWFRVYDFFEFYVPRAVFDVSTYVGNEPGARALQSARERISAALEQEHSGFRFLEDRFVPITTQSEVNAIDAALNNLKDHVARQHLQEAIAHLARRPQPDLRNSIKESISAVEALANCIAGTKDELGTALAVLQKKYGLHGALKAGFASLYGYTSNADGIRHALMDEPNLQIEDAVYMLVNCSAFVSYLVAKAARLGISLEGK